LLDDTSQDNLFVLLHRLALTTKKHAGRKVGRILYINCKLFLKVLRESLFWIRVSLKADLVAMEVVRPLLKEGHELANITAKISGDSKKKYVERRGKIIPRSRV